MQKNKNYTTPFIIFFIVSILILLFWKIAILQAPLGFVSSIFSGIRSAEVSVVNKDGNTNLENLPKIVDQEKLIKENNALSDQFAISYPSPKILLPAKIVGAPTFIPGVSTPDFFILDKGYSDGIRKGQAVVIKSNLIGKISETNSHLSKVVIVTDPSVSFTGKLESDAVGVVKGLGDGLEIGNILLAENVSKNGLVLTKGDIDINGIGIPPDLIVGKIISIEKKPSDLFQKALVKSEIDFTKINTVFVVIK